MDVQSLVWIAFFIVSLIAMLVLIPGDKIRRLLPFGIVGGAVLALIVQWVAVPVLDLWRFHYLSLFSFQGIPLGLVLAWFPATVIFGAYFESMHSLAAKLLYVLAFALIITIIEYGFVLAGYRSFINWNIVNSFLLAAAIHSVLAAYLARVYYAQPENLEDEV